MRCNVARTADNALFPQEKQGKLVADNKKPVLNVVFCPTATGTHGAFTTCWTREPDYGEDGLVIGNDPHRTKENISRQKKKTS